MYNYENFHTWHNCSCLLAIQVKVTLQQAMKLQKGSRVTAVPLL
jgi:hypothetical protein